MAPPIARVMWNLTLVTATLINGSRIPLGYSFSLVDTMDDLPIAQNSPGVHSTTYDEL